MWAKFIRRMTIVQATYFFSSMVEDTVKTSIFKVLCCKAQYTEKCALSSQMERERKSVDQHLSISALVSGGRKGSGCCQACPTTTLIIVWSKNALLWLGTPFRVFLLDTVQSFHSLGWCRIHFYHHLNNLSCQWEARLGLLPAFFARPYIDF